MKSRVARIKEGMVWQKDGPKCGNCKSFTSDIIKTKSYNGTFLFETEKNKRCSIGSFVTGKTNWCPSHEREL